VVIGAPSLDNLKRECRQKVARKGRKMWKNGRNPPE